MAEHAYQPSREQADTLGIIKRSKLYPNEAPARGRHGRLVAWHSGIGPVVTPHTMPGTRVVGGRTASASAETYSGTPDRQGPRAMNATKTDRELALNIIASRVGVDLMCIRKVERVVDEQDEEDGGDVVHLCGELETLGGQIGHFSIPEHWPEGTTITWA